MTPEIKNFIIECIKQKSMCDSLYMAQLQFKNCTPEQMNQEYGESGRTRNEILKEYQDHEKKIEDAIKAIKEIK